MAEGGYPLPSAKSTQGFVSLLTSLLFAVICIYGATSGRQSKAALERPGKLSEEIVTEIVPLKAFYRPSTQPRITTRTLYQDIKNPLRYRYYRAACGRDRRLKQLWGED